MNEKLNKTEVLRLIERLKQEKNKSEINKILEQLIFVDGRQITTNVRPANSQLFRIVKVPTKGECQQDYSYAPKPEWCSKGRCNEEGEQVFYGSSSIATCLNEQKDIEVGDFVRVGRWTITSPLMYISYFNQNIHINEIHSLIYELLTELFSNEGDKYYEHTIVLTQMAFELNFYAAQKICGTQKINAITYPSTLKTNKNPIPENIAIKKEFVDNYMELIACWYYEITGVDNNCYEYKKLASGEVKNGLINWTRCEIFKGISNSSATFIKESEGLRLIKGKAIIENPSKNIDR
jgi:hypothetical protein